MYNLPHLLKNVLFVIIITKSLSFVYGQNIDLEHFGKGEKFSLNGNISGNSVFFNSTDQSSRDPFTYYLQGSLNFKVLNFSFPVSYSYSNQGANLSYQLPFKFNRLSLHPQYKWIQGHFGDANMSYSPYTLNGHQFTGVGVDLKPKGKFLFSAMSGRLLKATEIDENPQSVGSFNRNGYGGKIFFKDEKFALGLISFYAIDDPQSIQSVESKNKITPKENFVFSLEGQFQAFKSLDINAIFSTSILTQDLNAVKNEGKIPFFESFIKNNITTNAFKAAKSSLKYTFGKTVLGVEYEYIEPGYQTLGAYYFNNDFQNTTVNISSVLLDKYSISFRGGLQRDDINNTKENKTLRKVGSINTNLNFTDKFNINASYSNFSTFTNAKLNQFDIVNDDNLLDNLADQYNYTQLSQNANISINYFLSKKESVNQNLNLNYNLAGVINEQNNVVRIGDASTFHNINTNYQISFPKQEFTINSSLNYTLNTIGEENNTTWGPVFNFIGKTLNKKLTYTMIFSYNQNVTKITTTNITSIRLNTSFQIRKKHNFNTNLIQLFKSIPASNLSKELTFTFGYNYGF